MKNNTVLEIVFKSNNIRQFAGTTILSIINIIWYKGRHKRAVYNF